jgi:hypothetical protein
VRNANVVTTHQPAVVPLYLALAVLPGIAFARSEGSPSSAPACPALHRESVTSPQDAQPHLFGYGLLRAGRVDDAIAFFQLHVVPPRTRSAPLHTAHQHLTTAL